MKFQFVKLLFPFLFLLFTQCSNGQPTITGTFPQLANQTVKLEGFNDLDTYVIDSVKANAQGEFTVKYKPADVGMGYLVAKAGKPFIVVLSGDNIELKGDAFSMLQSVEILKGEENMLFAQYAAEHPRREQTLSAWVYLEKIYRKDEMFAKQETPLNAILQEKNRIEEEDEQFLASLPSGSYVKWYLPMRKTISAVSTIAQYRTEEIPATVAFFRNMDYTDERLAKSGLLRDAIKGHFWLIENSGRPLDSIYVEMKISIDKMIENLVTDEEKLNEISDYLFKLLEKRSLFEASEYLALKLLNEKSCTINNDLASQLESYRAMKKGNKAPDFTFPTDYLAPGYNAQNKPTKLSDIQTDYTVVVFGASWCPQCPDELVQIAQLYDTWKKQGLEVVFVSLDTEKQLFKRFAGRFPFISMCDYQKWDSSIVMDYYVFATPTIYLLDNKQKIVLRPNSVKHLSSWVDWYLVNGNK
ncbi:Thiol-disulfide oxidoreductase ResA [Salinivirga cyanobacteriivorans]|uniref:Thiol-disulfide oxidoreductase ResA n=1 Tax=Salinivirga cyanobacteriivorans TaxID=1307839 RepID=A0A0S2HVX7_9BACT|nr:TlpA disulfide reductase family protein [Salinivirga cyanobacteriivorans]ALO14205.1 Thiol-disulfide oxidoreductase ResA [Salinivirga cyanobacteriivorans]